MFGESNRVENVHGFCSLENYINTVYFIDVFFFFTVPFLRRLNITLFDFFIFFIIIQVHWVLLGS